MAGDSAKPVKVLVVGNYPPPMCGWKSRPTSSRPSCAAATYLDEDAADMCAKMAYVTENYDKIRAQTDGSANDDAQDNIACMWRTG
jgi:hypothetical protein